MADAAASPRRTFRDPASAARLARDGFVVVDALTRDDAAILRAQALAAIDPAVPVNDPQGALYGTLFDGPRRARGTALADGVLGPLMERLLDDFRYEGGYVVAKPVGAGRLDLHQHQPVTRDVYEPVFHAWLTLDDCDDASGALRVVRGSHALTRHVQSFSSAPYFAGFADALEDAHAETIVLRAGQAIVFERSLLHGSAANRSDTPRLRLLGTAIPVESTLCVLAEPEIGRFEALEVGATEIDADLYCIAGENRATLVSAGFIDNRNEALTEREFVALLAAGARIAPGHDPIDDVRRPRFRWRRS